MVNVIITNQCSGHIYTLGYGGYGLGYGLGYRGYGYGLWKRDAEAEHSMMVRVCN